MSHVNAITFTIVVVLFLVVTGVGFAAVRWRRAEDMLHLNEWGLGGRGFGTFVTWFMLGGDVYTAYTYIAVPALIFGSGSIGFFAVSYTIMVYPIIIIFLPRLWSVSRVHNYITPADFIRGRYGSRGLSLAAAFTGILSLMPYIALQLVGIQAVITVMGVGTSSNNTFVKDLPLFIAFLVLAIFTYTSGLRAPALISFIKDGLVYVMVLVAVLLHPDQARRLGPHLRDRAGPFHRDQPGDQETQRHVHPDPEGHRQHPARLRHARARFRGSPVPLPAHDHRDAGVQAAIRRQAQHLAAARLLDPARPDRAARLHGARRQDHRGERQEGGQRPARGAVPVPAHVLELVRRGRLRRDRHRRAGARRDHGHRRRQPVHPQHIHRVLQARRQPRLQTRVSQWASLVVKLGALFFAVELPHTFAINLQLLGGVWILQLGPMLIGGLFTRWFDRYALLTGWLAGMAFGTIAAYKSASPTVSHWASSSDIEFGHTVYIGLSAVILNLVIAVILTVIFRAAKVPQGADETLPHQYTADPADLPAPAPAGIGLGAAGAAGDLP